MSGTLIWELFLALHLLGCALVWGLSKVHFIRLERGIFPMVLLVPLWGPLSAGLLYCRPRPADRWSAEDTVYEHGKMFQPLPQGASECVAELVPLEEALLLDTPAQCRKLLLLLLKDDPARFCALLELARRSNDSEVIHYAAAAMVQINKQADLKLQAMQKRWQAQPRDKCIVSEYCQLLQQVLDAGVVQGQAAQRLLQQLKELLRQAWQAVPDYEGGCQLAEVQLKLQEYGDAEQTLAALTERWPQREQAWLLRLHGAAACRDGAAVQAVLRMIRDRSIYLSADGRKTVCFWQNDAAGGSGHEAPF